MNPVVYVTRRTSFEASHYLPDYNGKCGNLHGHSYKLEVTVSGTVDCESAEECRNSYDGMVLDFNEIKSMLREEVTDKYDHANLNDFFEVPTAECMVVTIFHDLEAWLAQHVTYVNLVSVKLWETEDSYAEYRGEYADD